MIKRIKLKTITYIIGSVLLLLSTINYSILINYKNDNEIKIKNKILTKKIIPDYSNLILKDIHDLVLNNKILLEPKIQFAEKTKKTMRVIVVNVDFGSWDQTTIKDATFEINLDLINQLASGSLFGNFKHTYTDPAPKWNDPIGARWNPRTKTINCPKISFESKINDDLETWYGKSQFFDINFPGDKSWNNLGFIIYSDHKYFAYEIKMSKKPVFKKLPYEKRFKLQKITNNNFLPALIEFKKPKINNDGDIWNKKTIHKNLTSFDFNSTFSQLKLLNEGFNATKYLKKFIEKNESLNGEWNNIFIDKETILETIDNLENFKFSKLTDIKKMIETALNKKNSEVYLPTYDSIFMISELRNILQENKLIRITLPTLKLFNEVYETAINYFFNNKIQINYDLNNEKIKLNLWNGIEFDKLNLTSFKNHPNLNLNHFLTNNIEINYIGDVKKNCYYNDSKLIKRNLKDEILFSKFDFDLLYRENAKNLFYELNNSQILNGIILELNESISALVGTGIKYGNGTSKNEIITENIKLQILNSLNSLINKENKLFDKIYSFSEENISDVNSFFQRQSLIDAYLELHLNFNEEKPLFNPNNYDGRFYEIFTIKNWRYSDQTNGDFSPKFINKFFEIFNYANINLWELEPKLRQINGIYDSTGYFLVKLNTNLNIQNLPKENLIIENFQELISKIKMQYLTIYKKENWKKVSKEQIVKNNFFLNTNYDVNKYIFINEDLLGNNTKFRIKIKNFKIDSFSKSEQEFLTTLQNNPIIDFLDYPVSSLFNQVFENDILQTLKPTKLFYENYQINNFENYYSITNKNNNFLIMNLTLNELKTNFKSYQIEKITEDKNFISFINFINKPDQFPVLKETKTSQSFSTALIITISIILILILIAIIIAFKIIRKKKNFGNLRITG